MSERINLAEIKERHEIAIDEWPMFGDAAARLLGSDLPALVAWVKEACGALAIAKRDAEREGWDARTSAIDALLSHLEVERP